MWGNSLGWGISAIIVATTISGLVWISRALNDISDPTDFSTTSGAANAIAILDPPPGAMPEGSGSADSVALYHQAIDLYQKNSAEFDQFAQHPAGERISAVQPAVDLLRKAAGKDSLGIFTATPAEAVGYAGDSALSALNTVGQCAGGVGLLSKVANKDDAAIGDFQAAFCLGKRMADERLCYAELSDGLGLMDGSAIEMAEIAKKNGDPARSSALNQFATSIVDYSTEKLIPIQSVLSSIDQATVEKNAGDVFWLARNSKERMWRVESILTLGRIKYNAGRPGDNRGALHVATQIAQTDPDPVIKTAATDARELTLDQYKMLH